MGTEFIFKFKSEAPYDEEEIEGLKDAFVDMISVTDPDVISDSCELLVVKEGSEDEVELLQKLMKRFSLEVSVRIVDEDAEIVHEEVVSNVEN